MRQWGCGLALGYEVVNFHYQLMRDLLLALLAGKQDLEGTERRRPSDCCKPGAGKSTLNRLELTSAEADAKARYKEIVMRGEAVRRTADRVVRAGARQQALVPDSAPRSERRPG